MIETEIVEFEAECGDPIVVWQSFLDVVNHLSVTVLATTHHTFPGGGLTGVVVLGESHAAIHTWPERGRIWCELATCGDPEDCQRFREACLSLA